MLDARSTNGRGPRVSAILDRFILEPEVREHHEITVAAPSALVMQTARTSDRRNRGRVRIAWSPRVDEANDLVTACIEAGSRRLLLEAGHLPADFFELRSRFAAAAEAPERRDSRCGSVSAGTVGQREVRRIPGGSEAWQQLPCVFHAKRGGSMVRIAQRGSAAGERNDPRQLAAPDRECARGAHS